MTESSSAAEVAALRQRVADLELLAYRCAHDLKGRMAALAQYLKGLTALAKDGRWDAYDADMSRMAQLIASSQLMLDEVLVFANQNRDASPAPLSIHQLVRRACEHIQVAVPSRTWQITVTGDDASVLGQESQLQSVFENLFDNAAKSALTAAGPIRIEVDCRADADHLVIHVRDWGRGVPVRDHERVFEPFVRLDPNTPGTGLGLWIVRHLIHRHGGRVWMEAPESGPGTLVCFTLPLFRG